MSKVHIGKKGNRYGVWVAAPGHDASSEGGKMVLDSDRDMLKLHHYKTYTIKGIEDSEGLYAYHEELTFPNLGYAPVVFFYTNWRYGNSDKRIFYPTSTTLPKNSAGPGDYERWIVKVGFDRVIVENTSGIPTDKIDFTLYVYANARP